MQLQAVANCKQQKPWPLALRTETTVQTSVACRLHTRRVVANVSFPRVVKYSLHIVMLSCDIGCFHQFSSFYRVFESHDHIAQISRKTPPTTPTKGSYSSLREVSTNKQYILCH